MFFHNKKHICILNAVLFLLLAPLGGCGVVYDAGVGIAGINPPEGYRGKLYDPDFYRTATPEEARELVGGRSLAEESTTYTEKFVGRRNGMLGIDDLFSPVIPNSYVGTIRVVVRPVDVARDYSPSREVIEILERASGISREESLAYRLLTSPRDAAASLLEEYRDAPFSCSVSSILAGRPQIAELRTYLDRYPQADLNCTPQAVYRRHGSVTREETPLAAAISAESAGAVRLLRERGATLDSWRADDLRVLFPAGEVAEELLKAGGRIPGETCDRMAQFLAYADDDAYGFFMGRLFGRCAFSPLAEKRMMRNAVTWNRPDLVRKLLAGGARIDPDETYAVHPKARGDRTELKRILAGHGAVLRQE